MDELRYLALGAAVLVAIALPLFPRIGIVGLVLLFPLITRFIPRAGPGLNASTALFVLALFAGLLHSRPPLPRLRVVAPFLAFYALTLIGYALLIASPEADENARLAVEAFQALKARIWPSLLFFVGFALAPDRAMRERLVVCMVVGLLVHDASGLYDFATGGAGRTDLAPSALLAGEDYRPSGILDANPNILGGHLAAFSILALMGLLRGDQSRATRILCLGAYAVSGMALVITQSRGSWLAFLVGHAVWLFYANRKLFLPAAAAFAVLAIAAYSASLLPEAMNKRIEQTLTPGHELFAQRGLGSRFDTSVNIRFAIHATAAEIFADSPVWGHGFGSFPAKASEYGARHGLWSAEGLVSSESILLNTAVEAGLIGLLIYVWLFWSMLSPAAFLIREGEERRLGIAFFSIVAAILVLSLTQIGLFLPEISLGFWLMAGMVARAAHQVRARGNG